MYKAKTDIGDYKAGDEVPEEKALIWAKMYVESPVELVSGESKSIPQKKEEEKEEVKEPSNDMLDDYLARNESVVKRNIKKDYFSKKDINELILLEGQGKKRKKVIKLLKEKMGVN